MKIKIYHDKTYNIFYEKGDYVKVKQNEKYGKVSNDENVWGTVLKVSGKPLTAMLTIKLSEEETIQEYVWNVIPVDENGREITSEQLFKLYPLTESKNYEIKLSPGRKILKFEEFE